MAKKNQTHRDIVLFFAARATSSKQIWNELLENKAHFGGNDSFNQKPSVRIRAVGIFHVSSHWKVFFPFLPIRFSSQWHC